MKKLLIILSFFTASSSYSASPKPKQKEEIKGYSQKQNTRDFTIEGSIQEFTEKESSFEVMISKHQAIYVLPKKEKSDVIKTFLSKAVKSKKEYIFIADIYNRQIYLIKEN